jgi:hypothetical protein
MTVVATSTLDLGLRRRPAIVAAFSAGLHPPMQQADPHLRQRGGQLRGVSAAACSLDLPRRHRSAGRPSRPAGPGRSCRTNPLDHLVAARLALMTEAW